MTSLDLFYHHFGIYHELRNVIKFRVNQAADDIIRFDTFGVDTSSYKALHVATIVEFVRLYKQHDP
jgi:hypothetical protein